MDAFATLDLPYRLTLPESDLQQAYAAQSRVAHPDHGGSDAQASQVNAAFEILRSPEKRLRHLLELAAPDEATAWRTVPLDDSMMALFAKLGQALDSSNKFLEKKTRAQSALARALLTGEEMEHRESLEDLGAAIARHMTSLEAQFPDLDEALHADPAPDTWKQVATTQARLAYLTKWQTQIRERLLQLM